MELDSIWVVGVICDIATLFFSFQSSRSFAQIVSYAYHSERELELYTTV